jgi:eukaryotic-like serine/threonine-protein kinase
MSNSPPTTLGKYQIIREIARSNDIVYEAYDPLMNRRVALKELAMPGGSTPQQREDRISRFKREAQAAGTLNHPNIMTVYELGQEGDRLFMAMEYLDGHTLRNEIDTKGFLPVERAMEITQQVLAGLEHAHKVGVVHRDIKPDNIQILSSGNIKITDFGIARLTFQPNLTMDGQVFGTPSYMSPEQVVGKEIDQRSDLFSVGILLYEMIAGHKPFGGDSVVTITYAIMNKDPERLNQVAFPIWQVIERVLDKSPALRYASAPELAKALTEAESHANAGTYGATQMGGPIGAASPQFPSPGNNPFINPYQAPPVQNPSAPMPPPVAYPYNPYSQPGQTAHPPHSTGLPPGFANIPIYYPPPPRQPLIRPETKQFFGKLFVSLLIMGSLFALILVGINGISQALERSNNSRADADVVRAINELDSSLPLEQQITDLQNLIARLQGEVERKEAKARLAVLFEKLGKRSLNRGDLIGAEVAFQNAVDQDAENALLHSNLGSLYYRKAVAEGDPRTRVTLWQQAAESWRNAAIKEANPERKTAYARQTSVAYYNLAWEMHQDGGYLMQEVRSVLYLAQDYAPRGTDVERQIQSLFDEIRR